MALADHLIVMNHGRIEDEGPPERVYGQPATRFTATFMGESTIIPGVLGQGVLQTAFGPLKVPERTTSVAIRPEHVKLGGTITAAVVDIVFQGSFKRVSVRPDAAPDLLLLARLPADAAVRQGSQITLGLDETHLIPLKD